MSSPERRARGLLGAAAFAIVVVGAAVLLVVTGNRQSAAPAAARPALGALTVAELVPILPDSQLPERVSVGIIRDPASDAYVSRAAMDTVVETWVNALRSIGASVRVLSPHDALDARDVSVLVLPASPCVGSDTRHALENAAADGRGAIVTWLSGIADAGCKRVGYGLVARASGAMRADTLSGASKESYVTILGDGPLTATVPPGSRLELMVANHVALRLPGSREAYYSDFGLNPRGVLGEAFADAAIAHARVGRARVAYWGFDLSRVAPRGYSRQIALRLTKDAVMWTAGLPIARVLPWPHGRVAAAVLAQDVEDQFTNGRFALDSLRAAHVPGTYYLISRLALRNKGLARAMAEQGEVGTHMPRHRAIDGLPADVQRARLSQTQADLADILGHRVAGLRPPEEQFDLATLHEWVRAGGTYIFGSNNSRSASPEILSVGKDRLVMLGRVINDDFISVRRAGRTDVNALASEYLAGLDKVRALGGLYILSYHSQLLARPELVPALARVARHVASDTTLWVTTAGEVAKWWTRRAALRVSVEGARIVVRNVGPDTVRDAVVVLDDEKGAWIAVPPVLPYASVAVR
jgi:peptidoglycan/xylan/chitin deacetylase (PgdA/CDA1 family)